MQHQQTNPSLWDNIFTANINVTKKDLYNLIREEKGIVWTSINDALVNHYGSILGLKTIEIGAGMGNYSALMARAGAEVTILDFSEKALEKSKSFFSALNLKANFIHADALALPEYLLDCFDVSMSFGLTEHFQGEDRVNINKSHLDVLKKGGITFIGVPNSYCWPYRFWKKKRELTGKWQFGEEYPYSRGELKNLCRRLGIQKYSFIGTSFFDAFNFVLPFGSWKRSIMKRLYPQRWLNINEITVPSKTFLDAYLGYLIILIAEKN